MNLLSSQIFSLRKKDSYEEAFKLSLELEKQTNLDIFDYRALAWTSYDYIKNSIQNKHINLDQINFNFQRYLNCPFPKDNINDSPIHKCMMSKAIKIKEMTTSFDLYDFFIKTKNKFGITHLGYWEQFETEKEEKCPSLMEKLISILSKHPFEVKNIEDFCNFIDLVIEKFPTNDYLSYYKASILFHNGEVEKAEKFAISFAKKNSNKFWVWQFLGDIYKSKNIDLSASCFCKSLLCKDSEVFKYKSHLELAELFYNQKKFDYARSELEIYLEIRDKNEWKKEEKIIRKIQEQWFISAQKINMLPIYVEYSQKATELFAKNLSWLPANIGKVCFKNKNERIIYVQLNNNIYTTPFTLTNDLKNLEDGSSLEIKGEILPNNKFNIFSYKIISNNTLWSLAKKLIGVVNHINLEKKIINILLKGEDFELFEDFSETYTHIQNIQLYKIGDFIEAYTINTNTNNSLKTEIVKIEKKINTECLDLVQNFSGILKLNATKTNHIFGFVDDIFIPEKLIVKIDLIGNEYVEGKAIRTFDKKKNNWGWSAFELTELTK